MSFMCFNVYRFFQLPFQEEVFLSGPFHNPCLTSWILISSSFFHLFNFLLGFCKVFSYSLCVLGIHIFVSIKLVKLLFLYINSYYKLMVWWNNTSCLAKRKGVKVRTHIAGLSYWMRVDKKGESDLGSGWWVREYELWCLCIDEFYELSR